MVLLSCGNFLYTQILCRKDFILMHNLFFLDKFDSNQKYKCIVVLCQRNRDQCNGWHSRQAQQLKLSAINIWLGYGVHRTDHGVFVYLKSAPHQPWRVYISETRLALNVNGKGRYKKKRFFGRSSPNVFSHPPTPGFSWDLGKRKVKFWSKKAIFGAICFFFWGVWTLFGNQPPHPPTFGKDFPKKNVFFLAASLIVKNSFQ